MNRNNFIPVKVYIGKHSCTWNLDISRLSLTQLFDLKDELLNGYSNISIPVLDATIYKKTNNYIKYDNYEKRTEISLKKGYRDYKAYNRTKRKK